jgi:uncharacterized membrane protein YgdD (TMEM256/DUF423 family)
LLLPEPTALELHRDHLLRLLLPIWGVAFIAGFVFACR